MSAISFPPPPSRPSLRLFSDEEEPQELQDLGESLRQNDTTYRTTDPVANWDLRSALSRIKSAWPDSRSSITWGQYETLCKYWERYWGVGYDLRKVDAQGLEKFFKSVEEWATRRSWNKNLMMLTAVFKSLCRESKKNPYGLPRSIEPPLRIDDLPDLNFPNNDWWRTNRTKGASQTGGHTPKMRSTLPLEEFQKVIDGIWSMPGLHERVWWETFLAWLWFSGMRVTQARCDLKWCLDGLSEGVELSSLSIQTYDSKREGLISVPLPNCLLPGLTELWNKRKRVADQPYVFRQHGLRSPSPFYEIYCSIWEYAIPCSTAAERELKHFLPHELRAVSCTNWDLRPSPDNKAAWLVTGHAPADVREACYFQPGDERLREIVNRFPMPKLHTIKPLFV